MKTYTLVLAVCFSARLLAQSCVTFAGSKISTLYSTSTITGLLRQPDGSYSAVTGTTSPPYTIQNVVPNYDQWIGGCGAPPKSMSLPAVSVSPEKLLGTASQVVAFGDFVTGSSLPGAAFTATSSPLPQIKVGVIKNLAASTTTYAVPDGAASVATADFNKDGKLDLAVVYTGAFTSGSQTAGGVAILLGNGDGTFQNAVSYPAGANALHATIADLNGDGNLDMVVAADSGSLTVLLGNGDGTFRPGATITAGLGMGPVSVIAQDFNGDGKLDLASANENGTISILLGKGDGTFGAPRNFPAGSDCVFVAAGDFNKDGKLDLAVTNFDAGLLTVLMGNGDGTFGPPAQYNATGGPTGLILTDFNHDGNLDIVVGSGTPDIIAPDFGSGDVAVLLGNGDGTFLGGPLYPVGGGPHSIAAGDLNGDGQPDLVTANQYGGSFSILLNKGNGSFLPASAYSLSSNIGASPVSVALADFNGDGKLDAAAADSFSGVWVAFGKGNGGFQPAVSYPAGNTPAFVAAGDLNGDGKPDLVVANTGNGASDTGNLSVLLNTGTGAFHAPANITAGVQPVFAVLKDLNGDGKLDLVVVNQGMAGGDMGGVSVLLGKGDGTFQSPVNYATGSNPNSVAVGDLNGDGKPDLVVATNQSNFSGAVAVLLGNGDGTFKNPTFTAAQSFDPDIAIADMNGDGKPDVVLASCCGITYMSYLLGNGDGTLQPQVLFNGGPSPEFFAVADLNGDGKPDLAVADQVGDVTVLLNTTASLAIALSTAGQVEPFAPQSIVSAYGTNLAVGMATATAPLGTSLDGTTVTVTDSTGASRPAPLFYVSPGQVNFEIPEGTAPGAVTVTIKSGNGISQSVSIQIGNVSPGLFEYQSQPPGLAAAIVLQRQTGVADKYVNTYQLQGNNVVPLPLNLGGSDVQDFLELYGTGIRNAKTVTVTVGGVNVPVIFNGPAPLYAGEDQVNIGPLPHSLAGAGNVNIVLTADGQTANTVNLIIQ